MRKLALLVALSFCFHSFAQKSKGKSEEIPPVIVSEGISYSLPRTGILIKVKARLTSSVPGPYAVYADPLLGIKNVVIQPKTQWEITKVSFETFAEPDPSKIFKTNNLTIPLLQLTPEGILTGFNSDPRNQNDIGHVSNSFVVNGNPEQVLFVNAVVLPTSSGRTSLEERAMEAAGVILKARASRNEIVTGMLDEFHPDGKAYDESLNELRKTEKETLQLFTGKNSSEEHSFTYVYIPMVNSVKNEVIFRFDESLGFLAKNDFSGKPVMIDVEAEVIPDATGQNPVTPAHGLFYRQPGMGNIRLIKELTVIGTARLPVAQFGNILAVPAEILSGAYSLDFSTETGALTGIRKK